MGIGEKKMIWAIIIFGLALRLISLNQSLWLDEAINTLAVQNYNFFDLITKYARADFHPPGWFIILWTWTKIFGYSEIAVRLPSVIFGTITILIVYLICRKLFSQKLALIAALLLSVNPLHIYYSQEGRMYAFAALAVSVNILLLIKLYKEERLNFLFLVLSNILILLSDYLAYFIFPAQLIFLLSFKKELLKKWLAALALAILSGFWWLPTFLGQFDIGSVASANLPTWKFVAGGFDFKTLPLTYIKFLIGRVSLADKQLYALVLFPVAGLSLYLILRSLKVMDNIKRSLLLIWIIIPILIASLISILIPIYSYFRMLFTLPAFIILVSLGIDSFKGKLKYVFLTAVFLIELFCALIYLFNPSYQREHWNELVSFFKSQSDTNIILFESSGTLPPFDYYARGDLKAIGALKDFPARKTEDVIDLENTLKGTDNVYLVEYLVDITDSQRLVQKKLDNLNYKEIQMYDFTGVGFIYKYVKK